MHHFLHDVLEKGVWTPTKGASLKTFFIGQCLFQFANRYRAMWTRERDYRRHHTLAVPDDLEIFSHSTGGADDTTVLKAELADALDRVGPEQVRRAFLLREAGYTHAEIAGRLGLANAKAVENLLGYRTIRKTQERRQRRTS